jgi:hypothetical protein
MSGLAESGVALGTSNNIKRQFDGRSLARLRQSRRFDFYEVRLFFLAKSALCEKNVRVMP